MLNVLADRRRARVIVIDFYALRKARNPVNGFKAYFPMVSVRLRAENAGVPKRDEGVGLAHARENRRASPLSSV